jgi:hypothetical protein
MRQQTMCGGGGDDFQPAFVLEFFERGDEVAVMTFPRFAGAAEAVVVAPGLVAEGAVPVRAVDFLLREFEEVVEMPGVACAQERVEQHRAERGRE